MGKRGFAGVASARKEEEIILEVQSPIKTPIETPIHKKEPAFAFVVDQIKDEAPKSDYGFNSKVISDFNSNISVDSNMNTNSNIKSESHSLSADIIITEKKNNILKSDSVANTCPIDPALRAQCDSCQ